MNPSLGTARGVRRLPVIAVLVTALTISAAPAAALTFNPAPDSPFSTGGLRPGSEAIADLNGDGKLDLVVGNFDDNNLAVLLGDGKGNLAPTPESPVPTGGRDPIRILVGDFNSDGSPDLFVLHYLSGNASVLLGDGQGGFSPASGSPFRIASYFTFPTDAAIGDFNRDGHLDAVVVEGAVVSVLLGDGKGGFSLLNSGFSTIGFQPWRVAVGDLNRDGTLDLALTTSLTGSIEVLLGDGNGGFSVAHDSPYTATNGLLGAIAVGDFNGDGIPDVAAAGDDYFKGGVVALLIGDGSGQLHPATGSPFSVRTYGAFLAVGDLDGDGKLDVAVPDSFSSTQAVRVLLGDGHASLLEAERSPFATGGRYPGALGFGDFNGDGRLDIAVANNGDFGHGNASLLLQAGPPAAVALSPTTTASNVGDYACFAAAVTDASGGSLPGVGVRYSVTGANSFTASQPTLSDGVAQLCYRGTKAGEDTFVAFVDVNGDGMLDAGEPSDTATSTYVPIQPASLSLAPQTAVAPVATQHCLKATPEDKFGNPTPATTVRFSVAGASSTTGTATTDEHGEATFCYAGPVHPGIDTVRAFADLDLNSAQDPGEPGDVARADWIAGPPAALALSPRDETIPTGQEKCVTAQVTDAHDNAVPDAKIVFVTSGANNASGSKPTGQDGAAQFCYTGTNGGEDVIKAFADVNGNTRQDAQEPFDTAAKLWFTKLDSGAFVIGDQKTGIGQGVTFWSPKWSKLNLLSGGAAPPSFRGFASHTVGNPPACGASWVAKPGNSGKPPTTIPKFIAVVVSSAIAKSGPTIAGDSAKVVVVSTYSGYPANHGRDLRGRIVGELCHT